MTNYHHTFLTGFGWLLNRHTWFFAFHPFNSFALILFCHRRIQPLQQRSTFLIVQCRRGFGLSAVQRKRAWPLLVDLSHSTNLNTLSVYTAKVTHFQCLFLYPRTFFNKRTIIFPLCVEQWYLTIVSVFITRLSLPLKPMPHSGFHCTFQCTARRKIFRFKCRWNHLISDEYFKNGCSCDPWSMTHVS